jgi:hypothetical protein
VLRGQRSTVPPLKERPAVESHRRATAIHRIRGLAPLVGDGPLFRENLANDGDALLRTVRSSLSIVTARLRRPEARRAQLSVRAAPPTQTTFAADIIPTGLTLIALSGS